MPERTRFGRRVFLAGAALGASALVFRVSTASGPRTGPAPIGLGPGASLGGRRPFPSTDPWNQDVSALPVDPHSETLLGTIGLERGLHPDFGADYEGKPNGIPYVVVPGSQPKVPVRFQYDDESDRGPYPIPPDAPIESGGDHHILIIDRDHLKLYELFDAHRDAKGWSAGSGAIFDLKTNTVRPAGWTSADAAGLPIFPGLVRYDEVVERKVIHHALRFTCRRTRRAYVSPARHSAGRGADPALPPMGMRVRLKASFDVSRFPPTAAVILTAMKRYGMFLADNGSDWYVSGAPDRRWDNDELHTLKRVKGHDFEVIAMGPATKE